MKHNTTKKRLMELADINEAPNYFSGPASEALSLLAAPELKKYMEQLAEMLEDSQYMAIKKLYDGLYAELKKYE
jgi:hypothetical protein